MTDEFPQLKREELEKFIEEYLDLDRRMQRPQGYFSILPGSRESQYQETLSYFLDPQKTHGFRYTLLDQFLRCIEFYEFNLPGQHIEISDEVHITDEKSDGRVDLIIAGGNALNSHPRWAIFLELKVGAPEGTGQTGKYAETDRWDFNWFDTSRLEVDELESHKYVYLKRAVADEPVSDAFQSVSWADIVRGFEDGIQESLFEYPNRSVVQFMDFIRSLRQTENMESSIDEDELNDRLSLYFDHSELIKQVEKANSQFESDFEDISSYLKTNWVDKATRKYDFDDCGWTTSAPSRAKYQKILPAYWDQDPLGSSSTIQLFYHHSPMTELLRDQTLRFRLRLPPARNVHTEPQDNSHSFNELFTAKCTGEYADHIQGVLDEIEGSDVRLGSASALVAKDYPLDPNNLTDSYFEQLDIAIDEFCSQRSELPGVINQVFETVYTAVFDDEPVGTFSGGVTQTH